MTLPAANPPTARPYRSARTLAKWVTGSFFVYLAADAYVMFTSLQSLGAIGDLQAGNGDSYEQLLVLGEKLENISLAMYAALAVTVVAFCMWTYRVASNVASFGGHLQDTPGWAVGYYFIPFLNLWRPYQILADVWRGSDPAARDDDDARFSSMSAPLPWFFLSWWLVWLASRLTERVATSKFKGVETLDDLANGYHWLIVVVGFDILAVVLCLTVTWKLTQRQDDRAAGAMPSVRIVSEG